MKPRLVFMNGPLKDTVYPLAEEEVTVGRADANQITVGDAAVSRRHCQITYAAGQYQLSDLDSTSGTYVNGARIRTHTLAHGDQIGIGGGVRCVFLQYDDDPRRFAQPVQLHERDLVSGSTIRLRPEDALYLRPDRMLTTLPPLAQMARDLAALLKLCTTINALHDAEALQRHLLETIFEVIPAQRGAILLTGATLEEIVSVFGWEREPNAQKPVEVSRTIAQQVLQSRMALLSNDVAERAEFVGVASLEATHIRALLCVPLILRGRALGVIYLTSAAALPFDEDHLHLLTVMSGIAAVALANARHMEQLAGENEQLRAAAGLEHELIGTSKRLRAICQLIARVAPTDSTVLLRGESGTGKELAARALHRNSARAGRPFVALNCAALAETLLESELFGHERGAFTGALTQKKGKLELADGGTLFLDEVGETSPALQTKLLRVLQEREFERVGGTRTLKVDVRVVAATNKDLQQAIADNQFRLDLYYRLNVVSFEMPALRERRDDISLLAAHFTRKYAQKFKRRVVGISPEAVECLRAYDWPGNVRELENAIERAVVLGATETILPEDLPESILDAAPPVAPGTPVTQYHEALKQAKRQLILRAVERAGGSYTEAARLLGVHPNYLHRLIRNLNLKPALKKE